MLWFADQAFFVVHLLLILFNMLGWIWQRTRVLHLVTLGMTAFSWFVLGAWYGWGYCLCTDWHFRIRRELGHADLESSYIQLLFRKLLGISLNHTVANTLAVGVFAGIVLATVMVWGGQIRRMRAGTATAEPR